MLDAKELEQVREYVIKILPELLRSEPEIGTTIEGILAQHFPRRDEFARLLDEVREFRQETNQRFDELHEFRQETNQRFEQVDERLGNLEKTQLQMRRELAQLRSGQDALNRHVTGALAWMRYIEGDLRADKGQTVEDAVAAGLRFGLKNPDIKGEQIRLRQRLVDREGAVFYKGYETEIDLIATNGLLTVVEIKSSGKKVGEVGLLRMKVNLVAAQHPDKQVRGVLVALNASAEVREIAEREGIELVE